MDYWSIYSHEISKHILFWKCVKRFLISKKIVRQIAKQNVLISFNSVHATLMIMSSNGNIFRVTGPLCGEFTGPGEFPTQRPVTRSFDVFFDLRLNKRLSKQPWGWWFETPSWSSWRHCNGQQRRHLMLPSLEQGHILLPRHDVVARLPW